MPVQTKSRNKPAPDPFDDPNAIRVVSSHPPKVPSKRDTGTDIQRDATETRNQGPQRARPTRSQTQQNVGNGRTQVPPPRRSLSQDSAPVPPVPEKEKSKPTKRSGKKNSTHADVIDRLDYSGVGPMLHHDGPFDACAPSRNKHRIKAPMAAWSAQTRQAIEEDFRAAKESPRYEPPRKKVDAIAEAWGIHEPEPYEDFSAGGGLSNDYRHNTISRRSEETPPQSGRRREAPPRRTALPPPKPIFVAETDADFIAPEPSPPLFSGDGTGGTGMKRSKSLLQRIRRMRESPNMPVHNEDSNGVQNTYESGGSGRSPQSQNSFAGRLVGGGFREQLPPPQESDMYVPAEANKHKDLPRPPKINSVNSGERGYFEQADVAEQSPATGLGRKRSLMQRVGGVVKGRK